MIAIEIVYEIVLSDGYRNPGGCRERRTKPSTESAESVAECPGGHILETEKHKTKNKQTNKQTNKQKIIESHRRPRISNARRE